MWGLFGTGGVYVCVNVGKCRGKLKEGLTLVGMRE